MTSTVISAFSLKERQCIGRGVHRAWSGSTRSGGGALQVVGTPRRYGLIIGGAVSVRNEVLVRGHRDRRRRQAHGRHHRHHARGLASDVRAPIHRVQLGGRRALARALPGVALSILWGTHQRNVRSGIAVAVAALSR